MSTIRFKSLTLVLTLLIATACGDRSPLDESQRSVDTSTGEQSIDSAFPSVDLSVDLCQGLITHKDRVEISRFAKPPHLRRYRDPAFDTIVMRITDSDEGTVHKPLYSTIQAWNADESYLLLYRTGKAGPAHVLIDGYTYEPLRTLDIRPADIEEVFWSHVDPDTLFYVDRGGEKRGHLVRYSVSEDSADTVKDFTPLCGTSEVRSGNDVQMQSLDDDLFGFRCERQEQGTSQPVMFSYRVSTDKLSVADLEAPWDATTAPMPAPSGQRLYQQGSVLDTDLSGLSARLDQSHYAEHNSLGRTIDGQDALYQTTFDPSPKGCEGDTWKGVGHLIEYNLEDGACRPIVNESRGWPYTTSGTHISATASRRPGWIAMSSIGYNHLDYLEGARRPPALVSEIYLVRAGRERTRLCRLAQHRSTGKAAKKGGYTAYFGEPHATISPSGTRILFGSDWYDSGSVDTFVIELPEFARSR